MLDAELELYSREQDGSGRDPSELKRSLGGLRSKVPAKRGRGGIFRNSHVGSFHPMERYAFPLINQNLRQLASNGACDS